MLSLSSCKRKVLLCENSFVKFFIKFYFHSQKVFKPGDLSKAKLKNRGSLTRFKIDPSIQSNFDLVLSIGILFILCSIKSFLFGLQSHSGANTNKKWKKKCSSKTGQLVFSFNCSTLFILFEISQSQLVFSVIWCVLVSGTFHGFELWIVYNQWLAPCNYHYLKRWFLYLHQLIWEFFWNQFPDKTFNPISTTSLDPSSLLSSPQLKAACSSWSCSKTLPSTHSAFFSMSSSERNANLLFL